MCAVTPHPIRYVSERLSHIVRQLVESRYGKSVEVKFTPTREREYGDLTSLVCLHLARELARSKREIVEKATQIGQEIALSLKDEFVESANCVRGFLNVRLSTKFNELVLRSILTLREKFGALDIGRGAKVCVEYVSANPIHALHIGHARNAVIGDVLARVHEFLGYKVDRRFYVNDKGKQVAYVVYGYKILGERPSGKPDHWFGVVYSCTYTAIAVKKHRAKLPELKQRLREVLQQLRSELEKAGKMSEQLRDTIYSLLMQVSLLAEGLSSFLTMDWLERLKLLSEGLVELERRASECKLKELARVARRSRALLSDVMADLEKVVSWLQTEAEVSAKWPEVYERIKKVVESSSDPEEDVRELMRRYERGDEDVKKLFREVCNSVLSGFNETLSKLGVRFDYYDWESELVWSGLVEEVVSSLVSRGWARKEEDGAIVLDFTRPLLELKEVREVFGLDRARVERALKSGKLDALPPRLVLRRSDGTSLYTTTDIAYSIYKLRQGYARILNVIGADQKVEQQQVRAALVLLGLTDAARKMHHVLYEMVMLPGARLSSRRGRYVTLDEIISEAVMRAYVEVEKRWPDIPEDEKRARARAIGIGAVRYALASADPAKVYVFEWERVLSFEANAGPFIQYAYARASSIISKAGGLPETADFTLLKEPEERELIWQMAMFPEVVLKTVAELKPNYLADYANTLAKTFNVFYERHRVLQASTPELRDARLLLVEAFRVVMRNTMELLGIPVLEKM